MASESNIETAQKLSVLGIFVGVLLVPAAFVFQSGLYLLVGIFVGGAGFIGFMLMSGAKATAAPTVNPATGKKEYPLGTKQNPRILEDGRYEWTDWSGNIYRSKRKP